MHFSVIKPVEGRERQAAHDWADGAYAQHQWLWRFFPSAAGTARDFLFRRWDANGLIRFYVVSQRAPERSNGPWDIQTRTYSPRLMPGLRLHFDLRANPTVAVSQNGRSQRHDVVMREKRKLLEARGLDRWSAWRGEGKPNLYDLVVRSCGQWLQARAPQHGFELDMEDLEVEGYEQHSFGRSSRNQKVSFSTVDFRGTLTVVDVDLFAGALRNGIGRAKAFGCGLLLVRPEG